MINFQVHWIVNNSHWTISKMYNPSEGILNNSATLNRLTDPSRCSQMLPERLNAKEICSYMLWDFFTGAPQWSGACGTESKNILKSVLLSSKCFQIKLLGCANSGAIGNNGHVSQSIQLHLEPGAILSQSDYYHIDITLYNSINYLLHTLIQAL
jgi:hypothetical protein